MLISPSKFLHGYRNQASLPPPLACFDATEIILELRFGTGGDDSKYFVGELAEAYVRYAAKLELSTEVLLEDFGHIIFKITGKRVFRHFCSETGQHICQRVPVTERNGRRQTSIISVAVLPIREELSDPLPVDEVEITTQCGKLSCGGQNANKRHTAAKARHIPTGIVVFIQNERSQAQNKAQALKILTSRVHDLRQSQVDEKYYAFKKTQLGDGSRGSKIRTYNFMRGEVKDHRLGTKTSRIDQIMKGDFNLIAQ